MKGSSSQRLSVKPQKVAELPWMPSLRSPFQMTGSRIGAVGQGARQPLVGALKGPIEMPPDFDEMSDNFSEAKLALDI